MHQDEEIDATQDSKLALLLKSSMSYHYISDSVIFDLIHMTICAFSHSPIVVTASRTRPRTIGEPPRPSHASRFTTFFHACMQGTAR